MEELKRAGIGELRTIWAESGGPGQLPTLKRLAVRQVAWRLQSVKGGDLDAGTRRLLRVAIRDARVEGSTVRASRKQSKVSSTRPRDLPTGTKLLRTWRGRRHEVTVLDGGKRFDYRGDIYDSLTQIAEKITSAHWSGPRFFGLDRVRGMS